VLARQPAARTPQPGVDLVGDEKCAVSIAQLPERWQEAGGGDHIAAATLHRLHDDGADLPAPEEVRDRSRHLLEARPARPRRIVRVREGKEAGVPGELGEERLAEVVAPADGESSEGEAVVCTAEGDHAGPSGGEHRGLERDLDRLGPAPGEDRAAGAGRVQRGEPLQEPHLDLWRVHVAHAVQ
jgi:hypothetical protein